MHRGHLLASEAGERIRTDDVQLGNRHVALRNVLTKRSLCHSAPRSDQLGAVLWANGDKCGQSLAISPATAAGGVAGRTPPDRVAQGHGRVVRVAGGGAVCRCIWPALCL